MSERFALDKVVAERSRTGSGYQEFLRNNTLSAGVYVVGENGQDSQKPHAEDEIYYVLAGRAHFKAGEQDGPVQAGDLLYVPAGEPHRFHAIEEELKLLVFFAPPATNS
ncbi:MAG TPA: cupin domain-containing protein [Gemmataceae bacterium]|jgi:mannose-6-phosphate isomerase-like protein (cupin superfamily)|nr:cupin domain-containing protein [Gemmataceae bacterium]